MKRQQSWLIYCLMALFCALFVTCKPSSTPSPSGYYGALECYHVTGELLGNTFDSVWEGYATFSATPNGSTIAFVDSITINGDPMEIDGDSVGYLSSNFFNTLNFSSGALWNVKGANGIPSFSYNYTGVYPEYTAALPDTIVRSVSQGFVVNTGNAPGTDTMRIELLQLGIDSVGKSVPVGSGNITFSSAELANFLPDPDGEASYIRISSVTAATQTFGGKSFYFTKVHDHWQPVVVR